MIRSVCASYTHTVHVIQLKKQLADAKQALSDAVAAVRDHSMRPNASSSQSPAARQASQQSRHAASQPTPTAVDMKMSYDEAVRWRDSRLQAVTEAVTRLELAESVIKQESRDLLTNQLPVDATPARRALVTRLLVERCQMHKCTFCCTKFGSKTCRFRFPRLARLQTSFDDSNVLHMHRSDASEWVNSFNVPTLLAARCNHDASCLMFTALGPVMAYYCAKYITKKSAVQLAHKAALRYASAMARHEQRGAKTDDFVRNARSALLRLVSSSPTEVSAVAAAYSLINQVRVCCDVGIDVLMIDVRVFVVWISVTDDSW